MDEHRTPWQGVEVSRDTVSFHVNVLQKYHRRTTEVLQKYNTSTTGVLKVLQKYKSNTRVLQEYYEYYINRNTTEVLQEY